jgi:very-short-patch-repair endonuclease
MQISDIPFGTTDWSQIQRTEHKGETGSAYWRTQHFGSIRVRMVEYTPGYLADHWCSKGHIILCIDGMSYQVADNAEPHRSYTAVGAKLFIVD